MAKHFYEDVAGGEDLKLIADPITYNEALDNSELDVITQFQGLDDDARSVSAGCRGISLEQYDDALREEKDIILDRLDYYSLYSNRTQQLTVRDGAWFTPDSVEDFGSEDLGFPAINTIDDVNNTFWKHDTLNHKHFITWKLRDYPKKASKIRLRYGASENAQERLTNITIKAAKAVANIDEPGNELLIDFVPTWPTGAGATWFEIEFTSKINRGRFFKMEFDTEQVDNKARVREIDIWVETRDP